MVTLGQHSPVAGAQKQLTPPDGVQPQRRGLWTVRPGFVLAEGWLVTAHHKAMLQAGAPGERQAAVRASLARITFLLIRCSVTACPVFIAKAQKIEMDKLEKAKKERTKVSDGRTS